MSFDTVKSFMSPVDASKLSGRYETTVEVKGGGTKPVLRSLRHAPEELIIQGTITPAKMHTTNLDIDRLCDLFRSKAKVSKTTAKVDLVSSHETAYKGDDLAVVQLRAAFEETKSGAPAVNTRPRRTIRKDGVTTTATSNPKLGAGHHSPLPPLPVSPRRSSRFSSNN